QAIPMSNVAYYKADTDEALSNINEVIAHPMKQGDEQLELTATSNKPLLEVQNVNFKYWNQSTYTLQAVQLNIHEGEHIAVIGPDRKSTRLNSSHVSISYAVFCLK